MLKPGDIVNLTYYEFDEQMESPQWRVEEYDNGLLRVTREGVNLAEQIQAAQEGQEAEVKKETVVFNLRSIGFLKAELVEASQE